MVHDHIFSLQGKHQPAGKEYALLQNNHEHNRPLLLTIFGGTGDLAEKEAVACPLPPGGGQQTARRIAPSFHWP